MASRSPGSLSIIQYASEVLGFSSQYGSGAENVISYSSLNLIGRPTVYPAYGDSMQAFSFRNYGHWQNKSPFNRLPTHCLQNCPKISGKYIQNQDFVELKYEIKVYPYEVNIYETYNPGALNVIYAFDEISLKWLLLWKRPEKENYSSLLEESRIFSPSLKKRNFKTNRLLLEFSQAELDYYYQIDAVALVGSIFYNLTSVTCTDSYQQHDTLPKNGAHYDNVTVSENIFLKLPYEIRHKIFTYLDLVSLCRAAMVCRSFKNLSYDSTLYKNLNLQPYCTKITDSALHFMNERLDFTYHLSWLNLSWCRNVTRRGFNSFIERGISINPHSVLSSLRLSCCLFITDNALTFICQELVNLQELNISGCVKIEEAFEKISVLNKLEILSLSETLITDSPLIEILRNCNNLKHLSLANCRDLTSIDDVLLVLEHNCGLITLDLWRGVSLSTDGLTRIATTCCNLEDLNIGWCFRVECGTGCLQNLITKCGVKLRKLILTSLRSLRDDDLWLISKFCPYLEELDVSGSREITENPIEEILNNCRVLCLLDVSYSHEITSSKVSEWRYNFPLVKIKQCRRNMIS